jgi:hypothetical protein
MGSIEFISPNAATLFHAYNVGILSIPLRMLCALRRHCAARGACAASGIVLHSRFPFDPFAANPTPLSLYYT